MAEGIRPSGPRATSSPINGWPQQEPRRSPSYSSISGESNRSFDSSSSGFSSGLSDSQEPGRSSYLKLGTTDPRYVCYTKRNEDGSSKKLTRFYIPVGQPNTKVTLEVKDVRVTYESSQPGIIANSTQTTPGSPGAGRQEAEQTIFAKTISLFK